MAVPGAIKRFHEMPDSLIETVCWIPGLEFHGATGRLAQVKVSGEDQSISLATSIEATSYVRAQLVESSGEGAAVHALTNPIYIEMKQRLSNG